LCLSSRKKGSKKRSKRREGEEKRGRKKTQILLPGSLISKGFNHKERKTPFKAIIWDIQEIMSI
jgi:hypothetical protein